jgi:hypothetical protein
MPSGTFGSQTRSAWRNAPSFSFGTTSRSSASKASLSRTRTLELRGTQSADTFYDLPSSVGTHEPESRKGRSGSAYSFGKVSKDFGYASKEALHDPAPNRYSLPGAITATGKKPLSTDRSEPVYTIGSKTTRSDARKLWAGDLEYQRADLIGRDSPGPGAATIAARPASASTRGAPSYTFRGRPNDTSDKTPAKGRTSPGPIYMPKSTFAATVDSTMGRTGSAPTFRVASREERAKAYLSKASSRVSLHGRDTPGPAYAVDLVGYDLVRQQGDRCFGKQVKSAYRTRPSSAFAKASRWGEYERALARQYTPGPGAYDKVF